MLFWIAVTIVATGILWQGSGWLERSSSALSAYYQLPLIVQGALVTAVGSSFPELSTAVLSTLVHGEFELGVSAIVGSALFNILIIPSLSGLFTEDALSSNRDLVYKEAQFYIIAVAVLLITFCFGVIFHRVPADGPTIKGRLTRSLSIIPILLYGLYLFIQFQDTMDYEPDQSPAQINPLKQWGMFVLSLIVILAGVEALVRAAIAFGELLQTPSFLWGITVIAAATSIPDAFVSIRKARTGQTISSLANVLGSNIFDLLICVPAGIMIAGSTVFNFTVAVPMMGILILGTIMLFAFLRTDLILSNTEAWILQVLYISFVVWIVLESTNVVGIIPGIPPG